MNLGSPYGDRTRVSGLKDQKSLPLDERARRRSWQRSPHPESNRNPLSTKQVLCRVSFEGELELSSGGRNRTSSGSVNSRLPYHLATPERLGGGVSTPRSSRSELSNNSRGRASVAVVPGAGIEPALTGSESVVLPTRRSRNECSRGRHGNRTHLYRLKRPLRHLDANLPLAARAARAACPDR